jgi:H+/Cl- antiporter ClcA
MASNPTIWWGRWDLYPLLGGIFRQVFAPSQLVLFVAVGMAAFLAAGFNTPLAAVTFVAETAGGPDYLIKRAVLFSHQYSQP